MSTKIFLLLNHKYCKIIIIIIAILIIFILFKYGYYNLFICNFIIIFKYGTVAFRWYTTARILFKIIA